MVPIQIWRMTEESIIIDWLFGAVGKLEKQIAYMLTLDYCRWKQ